MAYVPNPTSLHHILERNIDLQITKQYYLVMP